MLQEIILSMFLLFNQSNQGTKNYEKSINLTFNGKASIIIPITREYTGKVEIKKDNFGKILECKVHTPTIKVFGKIRNDSTFYTYKITDKGLEYKEIKFKLNNKNLVEYIKTDTIFDLKHEKKLALPFLAKLLTLENINDFYKLREEYSGVFKVDNNENKLFVEGSFEEGYINYTINDSKLELDIHSKKIPITNQVMLEYRIMRNKLMPIRAYYSFFPINANADIIKE